MPIYGCINLCPSIWKKFLPAFTDDRQSYLFLFHSQVSSHEICHVFGMAHCSYFSCAMNESKSIFQAENQPLFLCPVCLRKLQKAVGFDIYERYRALSNFLNSITNSDLSKVDFQSQCHHSGEQVLVESCECKFELSIHWIKSILLFIENKNTIWLNEFCTKCEIK